MTIATFSPISSGSAGASSRAGKKETLAATTADIEGPFYRPAPPQGTELCGPDQAGDRMTLSGRVLDQSGAPIPQAKVDIWQADPQGNYDIADPADKENPSIPYAFRGWQTTDAEGSYSASTVKPGHYSIGDNEWRTGHIHVNVSAPGFQKLTTQLYFAGDQFNDDDHWFDASRVVSEQPQPGGFTSARYDIVLARS